MNIALIGMPGCGKSTIGKLLSKELKGYSFIDTDEEIIKNEKMSINDIFKEKGEDYFRRLESDILNRILKSDNQIISTGGGIVIREENITALNKKSFTIYLNTDENILFERIKNNRERPLLNEGEMEQKIKSLLKNRHYLYKMAEKEISTNKKTPDIIVKEIINELKNNERN